MVSLHNILQIPPGNTFTANPQRNFKGNPSKEKQDTLDFSNEFLQQRLAHKLKNIGDQHANKNQEKKAIFYYKKAIEKKPDYAAPYYNLARVYEKKGDIDQAISIYKSLVIVKPEEVEAQTLLGNVYKEKGDYETAKKMYAKAAKIDPKYDFASRSLKETDYLILVRDNPHEAEAMKQQTAEKALKDALILVNTHAAPYLTKDLNQLAINFNETDSLSGHKNIAQYEDHNKKIVITDDYIWAAPEVTAAYIVHEAVHAKDKDNISSIKEEQDAYEESIKFWIAHNNGIKDPELDYAAELYKKNPKTLKQKVGETYRARDASMLEYSPYHTPESGLGMVTGLKIYTLKLKNSICNMFGLC